MPQALGASKLIDQVANPTYIEFVSSLLFCVRGRRELLLNPKCAMGAIVKVGENLVRGDLYRFVVHREVSQSSDGGALT
jgi:hypothetical protein